MYWSNSLINAVPLMEAKLSCRVAMPLHMSAVIVSRFCNAESGPRAQYGVNPLVHHPLESALAFRRCADS